MTGRRPLSLGRSAAYCLICLAVLIGSVQVSRTGQDLGLWSDVGRLLEEWEDWLFDLRAAWVLGPPRPTGDVVVIGIDAASISPRSLGRWPWNRTIHANLIRRLKAAGARVIGFDVSFSMSGQPAEDAALAQAAEEAGNVVLAYEYSLSGDGVKVLDPLPPPLVEAAHRKQVRFGLPTAVMGQDERYRYVGVGTPEKLQIAEGGLQVTDPFALVVAAVYLGTSDYGVDEEAIHLGSRPPLPISEGNRLVVRVPDYPTISCADVLSDRFDPHQVKGRIALVASTFDANDYKMVASTMQRTVPGGFLHAAAVESLLSGRVLHRMDHARVLLSIVGLLVLSAMVLYRISFWKGLAYVGGLAALWFALTNLALRTQNLWMDAVLPLVSLGAAVLGIGFYENQRLRGLFGRFVPRALADKLLHSDEHAIRGSGHLADATVVFIDIRGYTPLSEKLPPNEIMHLLNQFHQAMGQVFLRRKGTVVSFEGDAQMVLFGIPIPEKDHAYQAVLAASELGQKLEALNRQLVQQYPAIGEGLRIGVGICTGEVSEGVLGMEERLAYTAIGDTTNLAARLQTLCRDMGVTVVMSESTHERVRGRVQVREHAGISIKGKSEPQKVYELIES